MNVHYAKFQKSLIVEQFQGNYLNCSELRKLFPRVPIGNVFGVISGNYEWKLYLLHGKNISTSLALTKCKKD